MSRRTILFVDDEPIIRKTLPVILENHGYDVTSTGSTSEALAIIGTKKFDLLISDLNIGEAGDGFTILSAVRRTHPETCTLLLTGYPDFEAALESIRQQVDDFLVKPAQIADVLNRVDKLLSSPPCRGDPKVGKRLSQVLQENKDRIIENWFEKVQQNSELATSPIPREERLAPLPDKMAELIEMLKSHPAETSTKQLRAARFHGKTRKSQGYSVRLLVEEVRILERCIFDCMQSQLLNLDISQIISDIIQLVDTSQHQLRETLEAFLEDARPNQALEAGFLDRRKKIEVVRVFEEREHA